MSDSKNRLYRCRRLALNRSLALLTEAAQKETCGTPAVTRLWVLTCKPGATCIKSVVV